MNAHCRPEVGAFDDRYLAWQRDVSVPVGNGKRETQRHTIVSLAALENAAMWRDRGKATGRSAVGTAKYEAIEARRARIMAALSLSPLSTNEVADRAGATRDEADNDLRLLDRLGLVHFEVVREGARRFKMWSRADA